jgi:hypothetical protein
MTANETETHISLWDALTGGNWLANLKLNPQQAVAPGDVFRLGAGITLTITGLAA